MEIKGDMFIVFNGDTYELCGYYRAFADAKAYVNCQHGRYLVYSTRTAKWCIGNTSRSLPRPYWTRWEAARYYSDDLTKLLDKV